MVQLSQSGGSGGGSKEDSLAGLISVLLGQIHSSKINIFVVHYFLFQCS